MVRVARQPLVPGLEDDRLALAGDLADDRSIVHRHPLPASPLLRRMPRGCQADEITAIITAEVDIAEVGAECRHDVLDDGDADGLRIERAGQRRCQLLELSRSLLAAPSLCDVAVRLEDVASTSIDHHLMPRLDDQALPILPRVLRFDLGDAVLLELLQQSRQTFATRGEEQFVTDAANGLIGGVAV